MESYAALALVSAVLIGFAVIHSLLVTEKAKSLAVRLMGETKVRAFYRLIYTAVSAITTLLALYLIALIPDRALLVLPMWLRVPCHLVQAGGAAIGMMAFRHIRMDEFLGIAQAWRFLTKKYAVGDKEGITQKLVTSGIYGRVRHPLYLAGILMFTFNPYITRNWIAVSVLADIYFIFGALLEERRLINRFGDEYREYIKDVPRFIPRFSKTA